MGRVVSLWASPESGRIAGFSQNGRLLFYERVAKSPSGTWVTEIYQIDLAEPSIQPMKLADGMYARPSPDGTYLAFAGALQDGKLAILLRGPDGAVRTLGFGFVGSWSPDGRWLTYFIKEEASSLPSSPSTATPYTLVVANTTTWQVQAAVEVNCGSDLYGAEPKWSPDSRWLVLICVVGSGGGPFVMSPAAGAVKVLPEPSAIAAVTSERSN